MELVPNGSWAEDWTRSEPSAQASNLSRDLIRIFIDFWNAEDLSERAETTRRRYSAGLHALGGYLVNQESTDDGQGSTARGKLWYAVETDEGPLIFQDDEAWQRDLDTVCRKLKKYLAQQG